MSDDLIAETADGKKVKCKGDGTWEYVIDLDHVQGDGEAEGGDGKEPDQVKY